MALVGEELGLAGTATVILLFAIFVWRGFLISARARVPFGKYLGLVHKDVKPANVLLVVDAMTGQDAVTVAEKFNEAVGIDAVILTKMDGDSRGGAALSVRHITGRPIASKSVVSSGNPFSWRTRRTTPPSVECSAPSATTSFME